jgi:hypothetical protein
MMSMKGHFDPVLLRHFIERNGLYPVGCRVRLSSGDPARVVAQGRTPDLPVVTVDGAPEEDGPLDLSGDANRGVTVTALIQQRSAA